MTVLILIIRGSVKITVFLFYSLHVCIIMVDLLIYYLTDSGYFYFLQLYKLPKSFCVQFIIISLPYLTRVPYHVDVGCYLTIQTKLLYLLSGGSVLMASFLSSFAGTSGRFPSGGPELSCLLHSL